MSSQSNPINQYQNVSILYEIMWPTVWQATVSGMIVSVFVFGYDALSFFGTLTGTDSGNNIRPLIPFVLVGGCIVGFIFGLIAALINGLLTYLFFNESQLRARPWFQILVSMFVLSLAYLSIWLAFLDKLAGGYENVREMANVYWMYSLHMSLMLMMIVIILLVGNITRRYIRLRDLTM